MIAIYLPGGALDMFNDDLSITFTPMRFADALRKPFTNDFRIPKTHHNMEVLGLADMLNYSGQLYGNSLRPAVVTVDSQPLDCQVQIVSIRDNDLTICVYENTFNEKISDVYINDIYTDDDSTIYRWDAASRTTYPSVFMEYDYGGTYRPYLAQYHPQKSLRDVIYGVFEELEMSWWPFPDDYALIPTGKAICPQNKWQSVKGVMGTGSFSLSGGQHVADDMDEEYVTFNRDCKVNMETFVSWKKRLLVTNDFTFTILFIKPDGTVDTRNMTIPSSHYTNHVDSFTSSIAVQSGTKMTFVVQNYNKYEFVEAMANMTITDYEITDDDYGMELEYKFAPPALKVYDKGTETTTDFNFDGSTHSYTCNNAQNTQYFTLPRKSYSYYGYYCNLPRLKLADVLFSMQWILGQRVVWKDFSIMFESANKSVVCDNAVITELRPASASFGRKNYLKFANETEIDPIGEIPNQWLEDEKVLHQSVFANSGHGQYTFKTDENGSFSAEFNDIGAAIIYRYNPARDGFVTVRINRMELNEITSITEVDMETYESASEADYVYMQGRKFMVKDVTKDLNSGLSKVTAVMVPTNQ